MQCRYIALCGGTTLWYEHFIQNNTVNNIHILQFVFTFTSSQ